MDTLINNVMLHFDAFLPDALDPDSDDVYIRRYLDDVVE